MTGVQPKHYERILTTRCRHNYRTLVSVHIDEDRVMAVERANQLQGLVIYTDSSGHNKRIGVAAVMMRNGRELKKLHYHLGTETDHTVYEAEATAVVLALHMLSGMKERLTEVTIGTDNQVVLMGLSNQKSKPSHHLMDKINDTLEDFQVTQTRNRGKQVEGYKEGLGRTKLEDRSLGWIEWRLKVRCNVKFVWTPGHEDIDGNEQADEAAKATAEGRSSEAKELPAFLRQKPLPVTGGRGGLTWQAN